MVKVSTHTNMPHAEKNKSSMGGCEKITVNSLLDPLLPCLHYYLGLLVAEMQG